MQSHMYNLESQIAESNLLESLLLHERSNELLVSIATLGLIAAISDGHPAHSEVAHFASWFKERFVLSHRKSLSIFAAALREIQSGRSMDPIQCACDTLNSYLGIEQKIVLLDILAEVLAIDGVIHPGEEYFLEYVASKLLVLDIVQSRYVGQKICMESV